jgi:uncharacterized protein involved in exopolysaccharide biosynthesis
VPESDDRLTFSSLDPQYFEPVRRQKAFIIVFVLSAALSSLLITYIASEKYEAGLTLFYQPTDVTSLGIKSDTQEAFGSPVPPAPFKIIGNTLRDAVTSDKILRPAVIELHLADPPDYSGDVWYYRWYEETKDAAQDYVGKAWQLLKFGRIIDRDPVTVTQNKLADDIDIQSTDSYVFTLTARYKRPKLTAALVDSLGNRLVEWLRDEDRSGGRARQEQLGLLMQGVGKNSQDLRGEWQTLLSKNDLVNVSEETKQGVEQLSQLQLDRIKVEADIKSGERKLDEIERKLATKGKATGGGVRAYIQPEDFKKMASDKLFAEIDQQGLLERRKSLDVSIAALEKRLRELPDVQVHLDQLNTQISSLDRGYTLLSDRYNEAQMSATEEHAEAKVLHAARVPEEPASPIKIYHVGLSLLLALLLGLGLVYLLSFLDVEIFFPASSPRDGLSGDPHG